MKQNKETKPFENFLMAYIAKEGQENFVSNNSDKEAEIVFAKQFSSTLSQEKVNTLISSLTESLSKDTLGSLVQKALVSSGTDVNKLQANTGLTASLLEDIKSDMVFTNSIPVKSLVKLLKILNVSLEKAQLAIDTTFERLSAESKMFLTVPVKAQPSFRKGMSNNTGVFDVARLKSDESYLYQNKEALDKYTKRLSELYTEI
ncbi:MAG: hypothetical protein KF775_11790 [Cyclobacteriaceae bacterium]|jgi:hypothetical protein|nr:hypothetical protein [Cyclobacteriaceae bacterium]